MKRLSIRQAIINAAEETDANLTRYPVQAMKWAKYIEREIGSDLGYKVKSKTITLTGSYIDLPNDCYQVMMVIPGNYENEVNMQYRTMVDVIVQEDTIAGADVYDRDLTKLWIPANVTLVNELFWEEIADQLHMIADYEDQDMTLIYKYIETDDKGYWIVNESHIDAITKFVIYKYAMKFRWSLLKSDKMLRQGHLLMVEDLKRDYNQAVRHARAEDGKESPFETEQY